MNKTLAKRLFPNTDLCVDIKTFLRHDRTTQLGKGYLGRLTRDKDQHYSFVESAPAPAKRNHRVFYGDTITVTQRDDGDLRLNFRYVTISPKLNIAAYASEVANELLWALSSLVAK